jgi:hypothetical protein
LVPFILDPDHSVFELTREALPVFKYGDQSYPTKFETQPGANPAGQGKVTEIGVAGLPFLPPQVAGLTLSRNSYKAAALSTVGAYFTGLSEETVLTLDVRFFVELRPTPSNPTLVSLSSPTANFDREALDLYYETRQHLPVGVPVSMNEAGDWGRMAAGRISQAARVVSPMLSMISPAAGAVVATGGALAGQVQKAIPASKSKGKQVKSGPNNTYRPAPGAGKRAVASKKK